LPPRPFLRRIVSACAAAARRSDAGAVIDLTDAPPYRHRSIAIVRAAARRDRPRLGNSANRTARTETLLPATLTVAGNGAAALRAPCNRHAANGNDDVISAAYRGAEIGFSDVRF